MTMSGMLTNNEPLGVEKLRLIPYKNNEDVCYMFKQLKHGKF